ncbi:MAG: GerMN domain-containing protein, partial [Clostridium sp.]
DSNGTKTEVTDKKDPEKVKVKTLNVNMYFYDVINDKWVKEKTKVKSDRIKDLVIEVRNNKKSGIPKKTKVYSVTIKDKIATVDLGREFLDPQTNSSAGATAKVYSIVNTLCLNKNLGIDGVMFLIDGKKSETIGPIDNTRVLKPIGV